MRGVTLTRGEETVIVTISTRTPHAGSDKSLCAQFNTEEISTRTPHAGSDGRLFVTFVGYADFNPHSPCGE